MGPLMIYILGFYSLCFLFNIMFYKMTLLVCNYITSGSKDCLTSAMIYFHAEQKSAEVNKVIMSLVGQIDGGSSATLRLKHLQNEWEDVEIPPKF